MDDRGDHGRQVHRVSCVRGLCARYARRFGDLFLCVVLSSVLFCAVGCSTTDSDATGPRRRTKFIRTQTGDQVTLQWEGKPGQVHSLLYATELNRPDAWNHVPGYSSVIDQGDVTRISFTSPVPGSRVYYRVEDR